MALIFPCRFLYKILIKTFLQLLFPEFQVHLRVHLRVYLPGGFGYLSAAAVGIGRWGAFKYHSAATWLKSKQALDKCCKSRLSATATDDISQYLPAMELVRLYYLPTGDLCHQHDLGAETNRKWHQLGASTTVPLVIIPSSVYISELGFFLTPIGWENVGYCTAHSRFS